MVPKTLAKAIASWPTTDLAELFGLLHAEIHRRAEAERKSAKRRPRHKGEKP
jgi:hypothetical protein